MQARVKYLAVLSLVVSLAAFGATMAAAATSKTPAGSRTTAVPSVTLVEIPQSVFAIPANPRDGRNPFFPQSIVAPPVITPKANTPLDFSSFVLNGITSPPKRTAMINGRTFEAGEEGEVKLSSGGKAMIKCEEIRSDSAVILVNGQRRELRLRFGL
jgi:hypothetical protein